MENNLFEISEPGWKVWEPERHVEKFWQRPTITIENEQTFPPETESVIPSAKIAWMKLTAMLACLPALVTIIILVIVLYKYRKSMMKKK